MNSAGALFRKLCLCAVNCDKTFRVDVHRKTAKHRKAIPDTICCSKPDYLISGKRCVCWSKKGLTFCGGTPANFSREKSQKINTCQKNIYWLATF